MKGLAAVGDVLAGKYRVTKILGIGGMGMVVAAMHLELDQRVAIKFMLPGAGDSPETAARFLREAKAAGRLNSDHVCRVMDVGRFDSGAPYIVMEYLQGESLAAMLRRRGPLPVSDAVDFILQAIEGLAEAHAHGIVHRDLKPDNLFLHKRNDGGTTVKVLDFGISKVSVTGLSTRTGDIMGSPAYMAPEQMESTRNVDHRADVWSLGVVLYQLVVGLPPFRGDTLPLLCMAVVNDEPEPMSTIRGDLPELFEAVVMKCLQKEPDDRYADVGDLARALAPFGPQNASTSASRIQIVLQRTGKHDSASTIPHELIDPAAIAPVPQRSELPSNTLVATSGQSLATRDGRSWGVVGATLGGLGAGALVVGMLWYTGWLGGPDLPEPPAAKPSPALAPEARPPAPIVEPIIEPSHAVADSPPGPPPSAAELASAGAGTSNAGAGSATGSAAAEPGATAAAVKATPGPDHKRRKPRRSSGGPNHGSTSGSTGGSHAAPGSASTPATGSGAGSETSDEDDKWMHMTHDQKKP